MIICALLVLLLLVGYVYYSRSPYFAIPRDKAMILDKTSQASARKFTEAEKLEIYKKIRGGDINQYGFTKEELNEIMRVLNK